MILGLTTARSQWTACHVRRRGEPGGRIAVVV